MSGAGTLRRGAYGIHLAGPAGDLPGLVPAPAGWPTVTVHRTSAAGGQPPPAHLDAHRCRRPFRRVQGFLSADRAGATATYSTCPPLTDDELVHPYLAPLGAVYAHWSGHHALHGAGLVLDSGVWGLLGGREAGKSCLAAALAGRGQGIATDDLLVATTGPSPTVLAGPRSVDLRPDAWRQLRPGGPSSPVREGQRRRLALPPVAAELPLHGFVVLAPGQETRLVRIPPRRRLGNLTRYTVVHQRADPAGLLDLVALPMLVLEAPRRWDALPGSADVLASELPAHRAVPPQVGHGARRSTSP